MEIINKILGKYTGNSLTPKEIVKKLDEYIIGQDQGKRAVAVAIRNRWRRRKIDDTMRKEVMPRNILMIGPTGVGKTEIARRLAALVDAPFVKVEASKYTEVGYHGRDVESMIRDLVKVSVGEFRAREIERVKSEAALHAEERILDLMLPEPQHTGTDEEIQKSRERWERTRGKLRDRIRSGEMEEKSVEIAAKDKAPVSGVIGAIGGDDIMGLEMQDMISSLMPGKKKQRRVPVQEALRIFTQEEAEKLIDEEDINKRGIERAEQEGLVFIDEVDKIIGTAKESGPDVSREGVQRDLLPIVEGSTVTTKFGPVKTDHILFIAAGAFHGKKPSDLIPELQGRFPIRVELESLTKEDFERILTHPKNALTKQYELLLETEGVNVEFAKGSLSHIAEITAKVNQTTDDIGARRLHTVMEKIFEEVSFNAPDMNGENFIITPELIDEKLSDITKDEDLSRFIL